MNEQGRKVDLERLRRVAATDGWGWHVDTVALAALLAVVDAARYYVGGWNNYDGSTWKRLNAALEPFTPAEEDRLAEACASKRRAEQRVTWGGRQAPAPVGDGIKDDTAALRAGARVHAVRVGELEREQVDGLVFNERMQETDRQRRLADLGIRVVDPPVSDAVSSGAGGRPVSHPGAENGPQILSRPASLDRERVRRDAHDPYVEMRTLRHAVLALLAELEQADERERDGAKNFLVQLDLRNAAEARLARVPALVEALREASEYLDLLGEQVAASDAREAVAEWEQA